MQPTITRHENGSVTVAVTDLAGASLTIAAGPGATPVLLRMAANALRQELMPGAWKEADHV